MGEQVPFTNVQLGTKFKKPLQRPKRWQLHENLGVLNNSLEFPEGVWTTITTLKWKIPRGGGPI